MILRAGRRAGAASALLAWSVALTGASTGALTGPSAYAGPAAAADDPVLFRSVGTGPTIDQLPPVVLDAHRAGGLEARENSLSGIKHALDSGVVDVVDLDVRRLSTGALAVMHDATVDRVTTSTGPTSTYTPEEWGRLSLDIGWWLDPQPPVEAPPTLTEVLERFGDRTVFTVEVKEGLVDEVARLLKERGRSDSVFVNTNDPGVARTVHELGLHSHLWRTRTQMRTDDPRDFVTYVDVLDVDIRARRADIKRFVASGVPRVWAHTVTTRAQRDRALRLGTTGVVADNPQYVAGASDVYPASPTVIAVRRAPGSVQASDRAEAYVAVASQSGPALLGASVRVESPAVTGRRVARSVGGVSRLQLSAARAGKGPSQVRIVVPAGDRGERRWPGARTTVPLLVTGEDLSLVPVLRTVDRRLEADVRLLDSAATGYDGPRRETGRARTVADLERAGLRLRVLRNGEVVHQERVVGADTGSAGDGVGRVSFSPWEAPASGRYLVRIAQRGAVYRHVVEERRVRLG